MKRALATLLLPLVLVSGIASAQGPAAGGEEAKTEARARFDRGLTLYNQGAYGAALAEFLKSRELFPTRAAAQNAALTLRKLNRFDEALDLLEQVQRDYPNLPAPAREPIDKEIAELRLLVGTLRIESSEPDARVVVDGRERGTTPLPAPLRVASGSHFVRVSKDGFAPFETRVAVAGKEVVSIDARLGALTRGGRLSVAEQRGSVVHVVVDGAVVGSTPWEGTLPVGSHTVTLRGDGDVGSPPAAVTVQLNQLTKLSLVAEPLECRLSVEPTPLSASVAVDGVDVGHGAWQGPLRCGGHTVEMAAEGFLPLTRTASLSKGKPGVVSEALERDPSSPLWRAANPPRVTIEASVALLLGSSLGGDLNDGCSGSCSNGIALGPFVAVRAGYQLGSGLGVTLDAGYLRVAQSIEDRQTSVLPVGLAPQPGTAKDSLALSGLALGLSLAVERGEHFVWMGRLGAGALLGTWSDTRSGTFSTSAVTYATPELTETGGVRYLYVNPEARIGYRLGRRVVAGVGLQALVLVALSDATWRDATPLEAGRCPNPDVNQCAGRGGYGRAQDVGKTMVLGSPDITVRFEF